jgi:DNA primase
MDPCDLRMAHGPEAVRALVDGRVPLFQFVVRSKLDEFDLDTAEGRVGALRAAAPIIAGIRDTALRPEYARLLSGWIGIDEGAVAREVSRAASGAERPRWPGRGRRTGRATAPGDGRRAARTGPARPRGTGRAARPRGRAAVPAARAGVVRRAG